LKELSLRISNLSAVRIVASLLCCPLLACDPGSSPSALPEEELRAHGDEQLELATQEQALTLLTDADLLDIATAVNTGELAQAEHARQRTERDEVRSLATHIIADHQSAQEKQTAIAERLEITPRANLISGSLRVQNDLALATLSALPGQIFDKTYVEAQILIHAQVLALLDALIPKAQAPSVRTYLEELRDSVRAHLDHAKSVWTPL
jgi:predicted outer membrane protein